MIERLESRELFSAAPVHARPAPAHPRPAPAHARPAPAARHVAPPVAVARTAAAPETVIHPILAALRPDTRIAVTLSFTASDAMDLRSLADSLAVVTRDGKPAARVTARIDGATDGNRNVTVTLFVAPPGGCWTAADNGTYTLTVRSGFIKDSHGTPNLSAANSFVVSVPTFTDPVRTPAGPVPGLSPGPGSVPGGPTI